MSYVDRILKQNAIDCKLNKFSNIFLPEFYEDYDVNPLRNIQVLDSKGNKKFIDIYDKEGSDICDFTTCNYNCTSSDTGYNLANSDTFDIFFAEDDINLVKDYVKQLFLEEYVLDETSLLEETRKKFTNIGDAFIFKAIDELINNKELVYDGYKKRGHIISRFDYYIFQPEDISDDNISIKYRYLPNYRYNKNFSINDIPKTNDQVLPKLRIKKAIKKIKIDKKSFLENIPNYNIQQIFGQKIRDIYRYVASQYRDYPSNPTGIIPGQIDIIQHMFLSYIEKNLNQNERLKLLLYSLYIFKKRYSYKNSTLDDIIINAIYKNYYTPNKFSYFITKSKFNKSISSGNDPIIGLVFIDRAPNHKKASIIRIFKIDDKNVISELGPKLGQIINI